MFAFQAGSQFKNSLARLMEILMSKEPSYVRCIKPNDDKHHGLFTEKIVQHQVKYLGLMENLRVRRAGFAYRRDYETFLKRLVFPFHHHHHWHIVIMNTVGMIYENEGE